MREGMLIVHFLGLAMGLGSSFSFFFLGIAGVKINTSILSRMGHIGLTLLIFSGLYLMTPFWSTLQAHPLLMVKLALVATLTMVVYLLSVYARRAKRGDAEANLKKINIFGKIALLIAVTIVVLAVLTFR